MHLESLFKVLVVSGLAMACSDDGGGGGSWAVRVYDKPFVNWIWAGCILMALGGFLALSDRRYRVGTVRAGARARGAAPAAG